LRKRRLVELIIDPTSGQLSASRLSLLALIFVYLPALAVLDQVGYKISWWVQFALIVSSVCGVYGVSTGLKFLQNRQGQQGYAKPAPGPASPPGEKDGL
jgi:hypothetical protein